MELQLVRQPTDDVEAIAVPVAEGEVDRVADVDAAFLRRQGFEGKAGQVAAWPGTIAVGLGPAAAVDTAVLRRAAGNAARAGARYRAIATTLVDAAPDGVGPAAAAQAVAEGLLLASYRFARYKTDAEAPLLERVDIVGRGGTRTAAAIARAARVAEAVSLARDLVNEPGGVMTARAFADAAARVAEQCGLTCEVWDEKRIAREHLGGLLGVNRGSTQPPRLVVLEYTPAGAPRGSVALVGKGITFDSGGLSLKTGDNMLKMKDDMGGAAAVVAAMSALADLGCRAAVRAFVPLTDNMTGGDATRVGDVLRIRNGTTVEVLNTDAEGRLILADGLSLATESRPDAIVDVATLTGACVVALGEKVAGVMATSDELAAQVLAAGERAGEAWWPLPLPEVYRKDLDSKVADLRNVTNGRYGGALYAGLFLRDFVGDGIPWAHLDIAGPVFVDDDDGELVAGATGFGVRTLLELLTTFKKPRRTSR
jgi:leucyl aminopeptidase